MGYIPIRSHAARPFFRYPGGGVFKVVVGLSIKNGPGPGGVMAPRPKALPLIAIEIANATK